MSATLERMRRQATLLEHPAGDPARFPVGDPDLLAELAELASREGREWKPRQAALRAEGVPEAMGGGFYQDTRQPFATAPMSTITLLTTSLQLWPSAVWTPTFPSDWWAGKLFHLRVFGKITTAATPGNLTLEVRYGTTDAGGVLLCTSAPLVLLANQTNLSWRAEFYIRCNGVGAGTSGALDATGVFECNTALIAAGQALVPASAPAAAGVDTTTNSAINVQLKRSGSTVETATAHQPIFAALN